MARHCLRSVVLVLFIFTPVLAQVPSKKVVLKGKVLDPNRAAVQGADVWASAPGLPSSSTVTDWNGEFSITLDPHEYQLRINAEGFAETTQTVNFQANTKPLEIVLTVGPSTATVTIT